MLSLQSRKKSAKHSQENPYAGKITVKVFTQDGIREIFVPSKDRTPYPLKLKQQEFERMKNQLKAEQPTDAAIKERLAEESRIRKARMQQTDARTKTESLKLSFLEEEATKKAQYLLKRAWELKMEQEDEIKAVNSLILKTKCQAIRDAQLEEKEILRKKQQQEEKRYLEIMEEERKKGLEEERKKSEEQRIKNEKFINALNEQLKEVRDQKLLEAERKLLECKRINEATYEMMVEEIKKSKQLEKEKANIRKELIACNDALQKAKEYEKEEAVIADLKAQQWMRQRAEREEALEREAEQNRKQREMEIAKLRKMHEKADELHQLQEHMAQVRRLEEYERIWRQKEAAAAERKRNQEKETLKARDQQIYNRRRVQAMEVAREKREFERIIKVQKAAEEREKQEQEKRKANTAKFREGILQQMNEREAVLIAARRAELNEGIAIRAEQSKRELDLKTVLKTKIHQLKVSKFPENYITEIARQCRIEADELIRG